MLLRVPRGGACCLMVRWCRPHRREVVAWLSGEGMSTRAIAPIVGADHVTVSRDLKAGVANETPAPAPRPTESELMAGTEWTPEPAYVEGTKDTMKPITTPCSRPRTRGGHPCGSGATR